MRDRVAMKCQKFVRYGVDRSAQCPRIAKWTVTGHAGTRMHYCGIHARHWRKEQPERVQPFNGSDKP